MNIPTGFLDSSGSVPFILPERERQGDDPIAGCISQNVRRLRDRHQLSLEALAQASGVRRAMLAQIEAGRSFASVKVLCKVASALKVSVAELLDVDGTGIVIRRAVAPGGPVTFTELRLGPLAEQAVPGDEQGGQNNIVVAQGSLELSINGEWIVLNTGDSILFGAEHPHTWRNPNASETLAWLVTGPAQ